MLRFSQYSPLVAFRKVLDDFIIPTSRKKARGPSHNCAFVQTAPKTKAETTPWNVLLRVPERGPIIGSVHYAPVPRSSKHISNRNDKSEHTTHLDHVVRIIIVWSECDYKIKKPVTIRVMFVGTQVDTISCKGADSVCCPLLAFFLCFFIMREAGIPHSRAAQCAAVPRPAPFRCPPCRCRGTRCGCSGGSCGSISPSARPPRSAG